MKRIARFFVSVKKEMKKVKWPDRKKMIKYSIATVSFILLFSLFFALEDIIIASVKMVIK